MSEVQEAELKLFIKFVTDGTVSLARCVESEIYAQMNGPFWYPGGDIERRAVATSGWAKRDPHDKHNPEVALKLTLGRYLVHLGMALIKEANGLVKHQDDMKKRARELANPGEIIPMAEIRVDTGESNNKPFEIKITRKKVDRLRSWFSGM